MKLPPLALTAPTLCPRCDSPAMFEDHCAKCALQLRQCARCHGVAGPFDRFCGFCGFELILGATRSGLWRLWLLVALIPIAAGLAYGLSSLYLPAAHQTALPPVHASPSPSVGPVAKVQSHSLGFTGAIPLGWTAFDYSQAADPASVQPFVVVSKVEADNQPAAAARGNLLALSPQSAVVELGRPPLSATGVDQGNPVAVLSFDVAQAVTAPAAGDQISSVRPAAAITIQGRPAAEAVLKVVRGGATFVYERAYILSPAGLFRVDAMAPGPAWDGGDSLRVEAVVRSLTFP